MCGRFSLRTSGAVLAEQFQLAEVPAVEPHYNIAPTQPVAVVRAAPTGERELQVLRWGLIPSWAKDPSMGARLINARAETVAEKPAFRAAFKQRRCLVLADGFYEWQPTGAGRQKQPFYFHMEDGKPFAFAGLWESWPGPDGPVETCTILTTDANSVVAPVHARMPLILPPDAYTLWLDPTVQAAEPLQALFQPYPAPAMTGYPVSRHVNSVDNDDPQCVAPAA